MASTVDKAKQLIDGLSETQLEEVISHAKMTLGKGKLTSIVNDLQPACPCCGSKNAKLHGKTGGLQRYLCICGKSYNSMTGSAFSCVQNKGRIPEFMALMAQGKTLISIAEALDVDRKTVYRWRDRLAKSAMADPVLTGAIEGDITELPESSKGVKVVNRPARKRGETACAKAFFRDLPKL